MTVNNEALLTELRNRLKSVPILEDEPDFFKSDETLLRYLKARDWNVKDAEKQLLGTIEWRRKTKPLSVECTYCHKRTGLHSLRQIGFDESGRPVLYSSFSQSNCHKNSSEESIVHVTYIAENATKTMNPGVTTFVLIIDCSGVTLQSCNPKLGYEITQVLSNHYPERLGQVFCVNHNPLFQGIWKAIKVFLHPNTARKVKLLKKTHVLEHFQKFFSQELIDWLQIEMHRNRLRNITESQRTFWLPNDTHDPRGSPSYVSQYCTKLSTNPKEHKPHPNIVQVLDGKLNKDESLKLLRNSSVLAFQSEDGDDEENLDEWEEISEIPHELQISDDAEKQKN